MSDPGLAIDEFEEPHAFEVRERSVPGKRLLDRGLVDHPRQSETAAEQALANGWAQMVEQLGGKAARRSFDPPRADQSGQVVSEGPPRKRSVAPTRAPSPRGDA